MSNEVENYSSRRAALIERARSLPLGYMVTHEELKASCHSPSDGDLKNYLSFFRQKQTIDGRENNLFTVFSLGYVMLNADSLQANNPARVDNLLERVARQDEWEFWDQYVEQYRANWSSMFPALSQGAIGQLNEILHLVSLSDRPYTVVPQFNPDRYDFILQILRSGGFLPIGQQEHWRYKEETLSMVRSRASYINDRLEQLNCGFRLMHVNRGSYTNPKQIVEPIYGFVENG